MKKFISYEESLEIINNTKINPTITKKVFLSDALDMTLAADIIANENSPAYPTSAMDGYAIKYDDQDNNNIKIIDKNPAGCQIESSVTNGTCIKTFTGSLMPDGADTLIPIENVTVEDDKIIINKKVQKGFAVREVGENYKTNEVLINSGQTISFAQIGVLASLNQPIVEVFSKPTVAIASTGNEILDIGQPQQNNSQIRSSNHLVIEAICKKHNANTIQLGVVKDDKQTIINTIKNAMQNADIVVTTGGVSVGDYDFVKDVIKDELGATVLFQGVKIKPGQHIIVAQKENKFIIGLPGFAYSSTVTALLYVVPLIQRLQNSQKGLEIVEATIEEDFDKKMPKTVFSACNLIETNGAYNINFDSKKSGSSAILTNLLGDTGLLIVDENCDGYKKGNKVRVIKI
jgi:molybdopterin molybdotransferase